MKHYYGCTICRQHHYEGEDLYRRHWGWQSKHGPQGISERLWAIARLRDWPDGKEGALA